MSWVIQVQRLPDPQAVNYVPQWDDMAQVDPDKQVAGTVLVVFAQYFATQRVRLVDRAEDKPRDQIIAELTWRQW